MELAKLYLTIYKKTQDLDFKKTKLIDARGKNVPKEVAYELGSQLASKLKDAGQNYFYISGDGRVSTPQLSRAFSEAMLNNGVNVVYTGYNNITPMFEVERNKLGISGVNITASHQPWQYNGFKIVVENKVDEDKTKKRLDELVKKGNKPIEEEKGKIYYLQTVLRKDYIDGLEEKFNNLRGSEVTEKILYDALHGPSILFFSEIARRLGINFDGFREDVNCYFPLAPKGPDPLLVENFEIMKHHMNLEQYPFIDIVDGDGDRFGAAFASGLIDSPTMAAVRAISLSKKLGGKNKKFVAEYTLASIIGDYLKANGIEVVPVPRGRPNHIEKILELRGKGENVLGGQEIGPHNYNEEGVDDAVESALLYTEILQDRGKEGLEEIIKKAGSSIKAHIHELREYAKDPKNVADKLLNKNYSKEGYKDVICNLGETEVVVHISDTAKQITVNAYTKSKDTIRNIKNDVQKLLHEIDSIEKGLGKRLREQLVKQKEN